MNPKLILRREGPESIIRRQIIDLLERNKWYVIVTHGNMYQSGLPDLYCAHVNHGARWIEIKNPEAYHLTIAQIKVFQKLAEKGINIYILTSATDEEYRRLWLPPNWHMFIGHSKRTW